MEPVTCNQCGDAIEDEGIRHRRWHFCSDECCESFEDGFLNRGGPDASDLEKDDSDEDLFDEDLFDADDDGEDDLDDDDLDDDDF